MPALILHDNCKCGEKKKTTSETCRKCYRLTVCNSISCDLCGKKRRKKSRNPLCRSCYDSKRQERIINDERLIGDVFYADGSNKYNYIRGIAFNLVSSLKLEKICQCCNFSKGVQICHKRAISDFPVDTPMNKVNNIDNLILLCPNCHWLFDHGYNSMEELKKFYDN